MTNREAAIKNLAGSTLLATTVTIDNELQTHD